MLMMVFRAWAAELLSFSISKRTLREKFDQSKVANRVMNGKARAHIIKHNL
jgi:hypothetical protein